MTLRAYWVLTTDIGAEPMLIGLSALALLATSGAVGLYAWHAAGRRRPLLAAAAQLGARLVARGFLGRPELELRLGETRLRLLLTRPGGGCADALRLDIPVACHCQVWPRAALLPSPTRVRTGDAAFDGLFAVEGGDEARALLTPRVRRALLELCGPQRTVLLRLSADGSRLCVQRLRPLREAPEVVAWVEGARPIFERYLELAG